jgi:hypothetical protein
LTKEVVIGNRVLPGDTEGKEVNGGAGRKDTTGKIK